MCGFEVGFEDCVVEVVCVDIVVCVYVDCCYCFGLVDY